MFLIFHRPTPPLTHTQTVLDNLPITRHVPSEPSHSTATPPMKTTSSAAIPSDPASTTSSVARLTPKAVVAQTVRGTKKYSKQPSKIWTLFQTTVEPSQIILQTDLAKVTQPCILRQPMFTPSSIRPTRCLTRHFSANIRWRVLTTLNLECRAHLVKSHHLLATILSHTIRM